LLYPRVPMRQRGKHCAQMRRAIPLLCLFAAVATGCAGGTPENVRARWAARAWVKDRLHPDKLQVSQLQWDKDRAVVALTADTRKLTLQLRERDGDWHVVAASG
jgi:hypothetical protein